MSPIPTSCARLKQAPRDTCEGCVARPSWPKLCATPPAARPSSPRRSRTDWSALYANRFGTLSAREVQILGLVATGKTNADIGRELHISEATVKTPAAGNKLGVSDRTAAVTTAMSLGLLREQT